MIDQERITSYLSDLAERGRKTFAKDNKIGSAYMACICGMWTNHFKHPKRNPFENNQDDIHLWRWWDCGYEAYNQAIGLTPEIRKQIAKAEREGSK